MLIDKQLQDLTQIICDIYSRFLFEQEVFDKSRISFLFSNELEELMLEVPRKAYGNGLDEQFLHPYTWINNHITMHQILASTTIPMLLTNRLPMDYLCNIRKKAFLLSQNIANYYMPLQFTSVEEVAQMADIDITKRAFWKNALDTSAQQIDEFLYLTK